MLLLAFDTAGPDCAVALARGEGGSPGLLARRSERIVRGHAERLMPMIESALDEAALTFADVDRIAVTTGPGSFTGVRVGVAAARALALALSVPAVGIGSLAALAHAAAPSDMHGTVAAVLDAKREELYALAQDIASGAVLVPATAMRVADLARRLERASPPLILTGAGAPQLAAALAGSELRIVGVAESPDIAAVARLGWAAETGSPPVPLYLRGADAKPQTGKAVARA